GLILLAVWRSFRGQSVRNADCGRARRRSPCRACAWTDPYQHYARTVANFAAQRSSVAGITNPREGPDPVRRDHEGDLRSGIKTSVVSCQDPDALTFEVDNIAAARTEIDPGAHLHRQAAAESSWFNREVLLAQHQRRRA